MTKKSQASAILKGYGLKLPKQWTGSINCWHRWHQHKFLMCWWTTYNEYLDRIIEVDSIKPTNERAVRFMAFRPVKDKRLRNLNLDKAVAPAWAEYQKATDAAWAEYQKATDAAWAEYQKAIAPAEAEYLKAKDAAWAEYEKAEAEYQKAKAAALADYKKAVAPAWAEYKKAVAPAWAEYLKAKAPALAEYQKAKDAAWAEYEKAEAPARENIEKGLGFSIKSIHDKECKDVPFIEESNELRFKDKSTK